MSAVTSTLIILAVIGFSVTALLALVRIILGPTILDRMVASDVLLTTMMLAVGTDMVVRGHTDTIVLMIILASTAAFASIMVARYVKRRAETQPDDEREPHV